MRKAASMFIFLVLGTACIIDLEPAETGVVERAVSAGDGAGDGSAEAGAMAARGESLRPDLAAPGADRRQACPWCSF
jgi:hypothetical protein